MSLLSRMWIPVKFLSLFIYSTGAIRVIHITLNVLVYIYSFIGIYLYYRTEMQEKNTNKEIITRTSKKNKKTTSYIHLSLPSTTLGLKLYNESKSCHSVTLT